MVFYGGLLLCGALGSAAVYTLVSKGEQLGKIVAGVGSKIAQLGVQVMSGVGR